MVKKYDLHFALSAIFLVLTIACQSIAYLYALFIIIPFGIFFSFLSWVFIVRARKELRKEFQQLEKVI
jgi:hypothetical protein